MQNGARLYLDVGSHPEYATPECDSVRSAIAYEKAGERILEELSKSAENRLNEEGIEGKIYLFKNNTDSAGNSYGCHENYLTNRRDESLQYSEVLIVLNLLEQLFLDLGLGIYIELFSVQYSCMDLLQCSENQYSLAYSLNIYFLNQMFHFYQTQFQKAYYILAHSL